MEPKNAKVLAERLIRLYLGPKWKFKWSTSLKWYGYCEYETKTIRLSKPLVKEESEEHVNDTILHEIAHALIGYQDDQNGHDEFHGEKWIKVSEKIGAIPVKEKYSSSSPDWRALCEELKVR